MTKLEMFGRKWLYHLRTGTGRVSVLSALSEVLDDGQNIENKYTIIRTLQRVFELCIHSTFGYFDQCFGTSDMPELFVVSAVRDRTRRIGASVYHICDLN
jgi:hypothetical protein